jgi:site-specific DNA-methyltransferase (adenine-specific)/modification methylase
VLVRETDDGLMLLDGHLRTEAYPDMVVHALVTDITADEEDTVLLTYDPIAQLAQTNQEKLAALRDGWDERQAELAAFFEDVEALKVEREQPEPADDPGAQVDKAEELLAKWGCERGQVWQIGAHRLMCGDSTDSGDVARLMGGEKADMGLTDPPYGVDMSKGFEGFGGFGPPIARRQYTDDWDTERPNKSAFEMLLKHTRQVIIWGGNFFADLLPRSTHWIVWDKLNTMPTYGDCELAWTNINRKSVKKITFQYNGLIGKEKERLHPTQKPVGLFTELLREYTETEQLVLDLFTGSGTTLVACEQTGRRGYGMEIEPKYCAVTLERLAGMGLSPELVI